MNASGDCLPHKLTSNGTEGHFTVHFTSNPSRYTYEYVRTHKYIRDYTKHIQRATPTRPPNSLWDRTLGFRQRRAGWKICGGTHACWRMPKEPGRCDRTPEKRDDYTAWHLKTVSLHHLKLWFRKVALMAVVLKLNVIIAMWWLVRFCDGQ